MIARVCEVPVISWTKLHPAFWRLFIFLIVFLGLLCQLDDACISNPCQKGSNCDTNPVSGNHFCTCPTGYVGPSCDQDFDECSLGKSRCTRATNVFLGINHSLACFFCHTNMAVLCHRTFMAVLFLTGSNPCEHAGKCINTKGSFQCKCQRGYVGARCELDINECMSNPCKNEATCLDKIGGFRCICMLGEKINNIWSQPIGWILFTVKSCHRDFVGVHHFTLMTYGKLQNTYLKSKTIRNGGITCLSLRSYDVELLSAISSEELSKSFSYYELITQIQNNNRLVYQE